MRKPKLIRTLILSLAIAGAASSMETVVFAEENVILEAETSAPETSAQPETAPPETNPPETNPPETNPPETQAPETNPPETAPPETSTPETEPPAPQETEQPETQLPETTVPETEKQTEGQTEAAPGGQTETASEAQSESNTEKETEKESEKETERETETERYDNRFSTNEALLANQNIEVPETKKDFRFTKKEVAASSINKMTAIKEEMDEDSKTVGIARPGAVCYILEETSAGWYYVESGLVRGFVKAEDVNKENSGDGKAVAMQAVSNLENKSVSYLKTSAYDVVVKGTDATLCAGASIYEGKDASSRVIGTAGSNGSSCSILADEGEEWEYVESGDVRGFVKASDLTVGSVPDDQKANTASESIAPENNAACYYTITSTREANSPSFQREAIVEFAQQFIGNPYVWGGTSLTNGADCSGFVQSVYANFGYSIPRVACYQAEYGKQIPVEYAQPGDLVFYAEDGYVYHVAMYVGDGMTVQAMGTAYGIVNAPVGNAVWATSIID